MSNKFPEIKVEKFVDYDDIILKYDCIEIDKKFYRIIFDLDTFYYLGKKNPIYIDKEINDITDGVYTWIFGTNYNEKKPHIYLKKVYTLNELGTKHFQIVNRLKNLEFIHLGGELLIYKKKIYYNFFSGTYMFNIVDSLNPDKEIIYNFEKFMETITRKKVKYYNQEIITMENLFFTYEDLYLLNSIGADIKEYDSKEECNKSNNYEEKLILHNIDLSNYERERENYPEKLKNYNYYLEQMKNTPNWVKNEWFKGLVLDDEIIKDFEQKLKKKPEMPIKPKTPSPDVGKKIKVRKRSNRIETRKKIPNILKL